MNNILSLNFWSGLFNKFENATNTGKVFYLALGLLLILIIGEILGFISHILIVLTSFRIGPVNLGSAPLLIITVILLWYFLSHKKK